MSRITRLRVAARAMAFAIAMPAASQAVDHSAHMHMHAGHADAAHMHAPHEATAAGKVRVKLREAELVDADGRKVKFVSGAMGDRFVVIDFVYTTCTTVCPMQSALLAAVQKRLGERVGRDVALITVTVDPVRDTPLRMKELATRFGAKPGWTFLTGTTQSVEEVLKAFEVYTPNFVDHPPAVLVGDARTGEWFRFVGFPRADEIVARMADLQAARAVEGEVMGAR